MMELSWLFHDYSNFNHNNNSWYWAAQQDNQHLFSQELTDEELLKLTNMQSCPLSLCIEWPRPSPIHIKASHCLPFYSSLFHARVKEIYSNSPGLWSFPTNLGARIIQSSLLSFLPVWKPITEANPSLRMMKLFLNQKGHINLCYVYERVCNKYPLFWSNQILFFSSLHLLLSSAASKPRTKHLIEQRTTCSDCDYENNMHFILKCSWHESHVFSNWGVGTNVLGTHVQLLVNAKI